MTTFLGIDYGERRVGLALADEELRLPLPLKALLVRDTNEIIPALEIVVQQYLIGAFVIGNPLSMDGNPTQMSKKVSVFAKNLEQAFHLPIYLVEEQLSSYQAHSELFDPIDSLQKNTRKRALKHLKNRSKHINVKNGQLDSQSACVILRDFLSSNTTPLFN